MNEHLQFSCIRGEEIVHSPLVLKPGKKMLVDYYMKSLDPVIAYIENFECERQ